MKTFALLASLVLLPLFAQAADPAPAKIDWKDCQKEIKDFACKGTDKEIWQCLEKHDDKLSESCDKVHEKSDKVFGEGKY